MTLTDEQRLTAAQRLITAALGPNARDDQRVVHEYGIGYADGGDNGRSDVWVTGDWNDRNGEKIAGRLSEALERIDVNVEWYDTVGMCSHCYRLYSIYPGCYGQKPSYVDMPDGDSLCVECALQNIDEWDILDQYVNRPTRAINWLHSYDMDVLTQRGWRDAFPDERDSVNGYHAGQDDTPSELVARIDTNALDYLFVITDTGQFDTSFRIMVRDKTNDDESE